MIVIKWVQDSRPWHSFTTQSYFCEIKDFFAYYRIFENGDCYAIIEKIGPPGRTWKKYTLPGHKLRLWCEKVIKKGLQL